MPAAERERIKHEIRNLVAILAGVTATLLDGADQDEEARRRFLAIMQREIRRLERLLDTLAGAETPDGESWMPTDPER